LCTIGPPGQHFATLSTGTLSNIKKSQIKFFNDSKTGKTFIAVDKTHKLVMESLQEIQSCKKYGTTHLKANRQPEMTWKKLV
jgi:hypothetical protein